MRRPIDVHRCRDGLLSERMAVLHHEVFGEAVDREAWMKRIFPGQSWVLTTPHGFLVAHRRHDGVARAPIHHLLRLQPIEVRAVALQPQVAPEAPHRPAAPPRSSGTRRPAPPSAWTCAARSHT